MKTILDKKLAVARTNNKGFTLVELIIVIAIIAILAGVLAPQFIRFLDDARISNDISKAANLESLIVAEVASGRLENGDTVVWVPSTGTVTVTGADAVAAYGSIMGAFGASGVTASGTAATGSLAGLRGESAVANALAGLTWTIVIDSTNDIYSVSPSEDYTAWSN